MQGLREAQALLDEGVLSQEEFNTEKAVLVKKRDERKKAAEGGVPPPPQKAKAPGHKCAHGKRKDRCKVPFVCPAKHPSPQPLLPVPCILQHSTWTCLLFLI